jgi:hypothetical protein
VPFEDSDDLAAAAEQIFSQPIRIVNVADGLFQLSKLMALPIVAKRRNGRQNVLRLASGRARLSKKP